MPKSFALAIVIAATLAAQSRVQNKRKFQIDEVRATGCVSQAEGSRCLLLRTLDGKNIYSFVTAPKPESGSVITIVGKSHQGDSACKEGIPIDIVDWQPTGERCEEQHK